VVDAYNNQPSCVPGSNLPVHLPLRRVFQLPAKCIQLTKGGGKRDENRCSICYLKLIDVNFSYEEPLHSSIKIYLHLLLM